MNRLGVPGGQSGSMTYDNAGNLTTDSYTGVGNRTYDAENRMLTAVDYTNQTSRYTYNADGKRTRRKIAGSQEEWQIFGFDGELLAEYRASSPASAPEKEYGYRNGQLLVAATGRFNVALAANGAVATASTTATGSGFTTTGAINGNNRGPWGNSLEGWNDNTPNVVPDWIQVDFAGSKTIDEISVFSLHDNYTQENTPTETQTFSLYGLLAFDVQYWNGSSWVTIPSGSVTGNNKVWRKFTFSAVTTSKIRVFINTVPDAWSRVVEIQAFGTSAGGEKVQWLVPDHLGTPRIVVDETGERLNVKRHDYLPFGEELFAGTGGRTAALGYASDGVRQQFTSQERDTETGLDFMQARYYGSVLGRFTSPDDFVYDTHVVDPQSWNLYAYVRNNPLRYIDPTGNIRQKNGKVETQDRNEQDDQVVQLNGKDYFLPTDQTLTINGKEYVVTWETKKVWVFADNGDKIKAYQAKGDIQLMEVRTNAQGQKSVSANSLLSATQSKGILEGASSRSDLPLSNATNCHGTTFAAGQVWIDNLEVGKVLKGDSYRSLSAGEEAQVKDVGMFSQDDGGGRYFAHSVRVNSVNAQGVEDVVSKGGITSQRTTTPGPGRGTAWELNNATTKLEYWTQRTKP